MVIDNRIKSAFNYFENIGEIEINENAYKNLKEETKELLKRKKVKLTFNNEIKEFRVV